MVYEVLTGKQRREMNVITLDFEKDEEFYFFPLALYGVVKHKSKFPKEVVMLAQESIDCIEHFLNTLFHELVGEKEPIDVILKRYYQLQKHEVSLNHGAPEWHIGMGNGEDAGLGTTGLSRIAEVFEVNKQNPIFMKHKMKLTVIIAFMTGVKGVSFDKLSDFLARLIRKPMIEFTNKLIQKYDIENIEYTETYIYESKGNWRQETSMPTIGGLEQSGQFVFVPRAFVFRKSDVQKFQTEYKRVLENNGIKWPRVKVEFLPNDFVGAFQKLAQPKLHKVFEYSITTLNARSKHPVASLLHVPKKGEQPEVKFTKTTGEALFARLVKEKSNVSENESFGYVAAIDAFLKDQSVIDVLKPYGLSGEELLKLMLKALDMQKIAMENFIEKKF